MHLERQLLFRDKKSLSDYFRGNQFNIELHRLYEIYLRNNRGGRLEKKTEIQVLNEVYYQCIWITNLKKNLSPASKANMPYVDSWYRDFVKETQSEDFVEFVACLIVGIFSMMPKRIAVVAAFSQCLNKKFHDSPYYHDVCGNLCEFKKLFGTVAFDFSPKPVEVNRLCQALSEWRMATNSFNPNILSELISRYSSNDEKLAFIQIIEKKAKEFNAKNIVFDTLAKIKNTILNKQQKIQEQEYVTKELCSEVDPQNSFLIQSNSMDSRHQAELAITKNQLTEAKQNLEDVWKQSEEYKQAIIELKNKLGSHSISLDEIANCILRIPDYHESYKAFKEINTILVGTVWQSKAQDVLQKILDKQEVQGRSIVNNFEKGSCTFNSGSTMNGNVNNKG